MGKMDAVKIFLGETLRALEDTFGHRHRDNTPFDADSGIGHALFGSQPDYTFNDKMDATDGRKLPLGWYVRKERTLEMEQEVFNPLLTEYALHGFLRIFQIPKETLSPGFSVAYKGIQMASAGYRPKVCLAMARC